MTQLSLWILREILNNHKKTIEILTITCLLIYTEMRQTLHYLHMLQKSIPSKHQICADQLCLKAQVFANPPFQPRSSSKRKRRAIVSFCKSVCICYLVRKSIKLHLPCLIYEVTKIRKSLRPLRKSKEKKYLPRC